MQFCAPQIQIDGVTLLNFGAALCTKTNQVSAGSWMTSGAGSRGRRLSLSSRAFLWMFLQHCSLITWKKKNLHARATHLATKQAAKKHTPHKESVMSRSSARPWRQQIALAATISLGEEKKWRRCTQLKPPDADAPYWRHDGGVTQMPLSVLRCSLKN